MAEENELTNIPTGEEPTPSVVPTGEPPAEPPIDQTPDPEKLRVEIEELEQKRKKAEEDALYWRRQKVEARADYFKSEKAEPKSVQPEGVASLGSEPSLSQFEDYEAYSKALVDYNVKKAKIEWDQDQIRKQQETKAQERSDTLQAKLMEGYEKYSDFEEVAYDRSATHITPMIVDILADCDHPADIAYYLAKHRVEGVAISRMTPVRAAREIAKLEMKLASGSPQPPHSKPKTTGAPPPISPLGGAGAGTGEKDPEKMTQKEWNEKRRADGARPF